MKKIIFLTIAFFALSLNGFSQDIIIRNNGNKLECKITNVDSTRVYLTVYRNGNAINTSIEKTQIKDIQYGAGTETTNPQTNLPKQENPQYYNNNINQNTEITLPTPKVYIGLGTGINNFNGLLGAYVNVNAIDKIFIKAGVGTGMWGYKMSVGLNYQNRNPRGLSIGASYSRCLGGIINLTRKTTISSSKIPVNLNPVNLINLDLAYYWKMGQKSRFYLATGYSILVSKDAFSAPLGYTLIEEETSVLNMMTPGGLIFGFGFEFGF